MKLPLSPRRVLLGGFAAVAAGLFAVAAEPAAPRQGPAAAPKAANPGPNDHTMFGGTPDRNMVNPAGKLAAVPDKGPDWQAEDQVKGWSAEWVDWKADLGSKAYGGPIVAGGRVFVGTNNGRPRNKRDTDKNGDPIDRGILMCFNEADGKFLWQAVFPKLESGQVNDWPDEGICSTPLVEGDRIYFTTNRCTVVCADVKGFADGNQGVQTEKFNTPTDCDVLWEYDMIGALKVFPHNMTSSCPLVVGDAVYVVTANGVDEGHINIPEPNAPSFLALDKNTGKLLWSKAYPGRNIMHGQWSNPTYAELGGVKQVIFPGGDGWLYGLVPETGEVIWKFDCNPKDGVYVLGGRGTRNDFIATPVVYQDKVYIAVGQDPEHTDGIGRLWCIAPAGKTGDISDELLAGTKKNEEGETVGVGKPNPNTAKVWLYGGEEKRPFAQRDFRFGRTMCTACIVDDILYLGELPGYVHVFNAKTGEHYWQYDTKSAMWGSCYYADGKVLVGNDVGELYVWKHTKSPEVIDEVDPNAKTPADARKYRQAKRAEVEKKYLLGKVEFDAPIRSTPVLANGRLYVMTEKSLFALKAAK
ncbi:MAG: PQQ-binding-like beta-propeller repeat protein [Gemmataceae bacterium]|nr:PQQ-binding-like beta-propeller repeat protein [Gemmataceae bacterium]